MGTTTSSTSNNGASARSMTVSNNPLSKLYRRPDHPPASEDASARWVLIKAKTRVHNTNRLIRKNVWFEAKPQASFTIGRADQNDLVLEDDRCSPINARITGPSVNGGGSGAIMLTAEARMYRLIGMGFKPKSTLVPLALGMVIKVGSVSLEVTQLCTKEGDNFLQRFDAELTSAAARNTSGGGGARARNSSNQSAVTDVSDEDEDGTSSAAAANQQEEPAPAVCYICWGGPEDPIAEEELNQVKPKGGGHHNHAATAAALKHEPNPLIRNPCGKCSGSSRYVHLQCILTWIKSSGAGHCSICNGALPQHFSSPPPNIELKVVRHRRGHNWVGNRRFRLSFVDKDAAMIGRDAGCDVRLSDRSVCGEHAKISFNREDKTFYLQDATSLTGTYVQMMGQLDLGAEQDATYVKIGRSTLSLRVTASKRTPFVRKLLPANMLS